MSRTSTTLKPKCGKAGIEPSNSFLIASIEAEKSDPSTGPRTRPGLTVMGSIPPPASLPCPRCALCDSLCSIIGGSVGAVGLVSPIRLCEGPLTNSPAEHDRRDRGRHALPLHPGVARCLEHTQGSCAPVGSVHRRTSGPHRHRRRDMEHVCAPPTASAPHPTSELRSASPNSICDGIRRDLADARAHFSGSLPRYSSRSCERSSRRSVAERYSNLRCSLTHR